jgi:protein-tyrosine phosphatase
LNCNGGSSSNGVWEIILLIINVLTAGVGVLAVGGIVYGAILYASAGDNTGQVQKAKEILRNVIIGIVAFLGMYAFVQFLIPGGVFNRQFTVAPTPAPNAGNPSAPSGPNNNPSNPNSNPITADDINLKNFRDASATTGGNVLKKGILYRSAQLSNRNLNDANAEKLATLLGNKATIVDVRMPAQVSDAPDRRIAGVQRIHAPMIGFLDPVGDKGSSVVTNADQRQRLRAALRAIANSDGPVLVHCFAGKDRTGWIVAMIMYNAGATDSQVMKEYMKSAEAWPGGVKREWMNHGVSSARNHYGSIPKYLKNGVGLSDGDLSKLRRKFKA